MGLALSASVGPDRPLAIRANHRDHLPNHRPVLLGAEGLFVSIPTWFD